MTDNDFDATLNKLAKRLGVLALPPHVRSELVEHNADLVEYAYLHNSDEEWEDLESKAEEIIRLTSGRGTDPLPAGRLP